MGGLSGVLLAGREAEAEAEGRSLSADRARRAMRVTAVLFVLLAVCATAIGPATPPGPAPPIPKKPDVGAIPDGKKWKDVLSKAKDKMQPGADKLGKVGEQAKKFMDKIKNPFAKMGKKAYNEGGAAPKPGEKITKEESDARKANWMAQKKKGWGGKLGGMFGGLKDKLKAQAEKFKDARGDGALAIPRALWL